MAKSLAAGLMGLLLLTTIAKADDTITATAVGLLAVGDANTGPHLQWRGSLNLSSPLEGFGGLSGLILSPECTKLTAISDDGWWLGAGLTYDAATNLNGATNATIAPLLDAKAKRGLTKLERDAEALTRLDEQTVAIAFESVPRIETYALARNGFAATAQKIPMPQAIAKGPENGEIEALGFAGEGPLQGQFIAIAEGNFDKAGNTRAWVWPKNGATGFSFSVARLDNYRVTDLAVLPGGDILILQRNFVPAFTGMAIARVAAADIKTGAVVKPHLLFEARQPAHIIDNMEAMAICQMNGETRVSVMSDDNYLPAFQSTLLIQFALTK
jgi:hypothetical protein